MRVVLVIRFFLVAVAGLAAGLRAEPVTFVFTSDVHYGISRGNFRGEVNVASRIVNAAALEKINGLSGVALPDDRGLGAGRAVGPVEFVIITGDLTNRQELYPIKIQSAAASWREFEAGYVRGLALRNRAGAAAPLLLVPGNHDVSNAIGSPSVLVPATDPTALVEIYNRMVRPTTPRTAESYRYATDRILFSRDFGGAHCVFLNIWPDSIGRAWLEADLKTVPATMPVFLFAHDPPEAEAKHFVNPNGDHGLNRDDKFENILAEVYADGPTTDGATMIEQRAFAAFLRQHRNIVAYFHGHMNWTEFYTWSGPDGDLALKAFRADSPMKGKFSGKDETKLSFQVVTFDVAAGKLTARECLWNQVAGPVRWGETTTVSLAPR